MDITFKPIGVIHSPFDRIEGMPIQPSGAADVKGRIVIDAAFAEGLDDLAEFSHIIVLYCFHQSNGYALKVKPFLDDRQRGVFATRAPRRPNPIGLSVLRLIEITDNVIHAQGIDVLDGTPVLDIKPYVPRFDAPENVTLGWLRDRADVSENMTADRRFSKKQ